MMVAGRVLVGLIIGVLVKVLVGILVEVFDGVSVGVLVNVCMSVGLFFDVGSKVCVFVKTMNLILVGVILFAIGANVAGDIAIVESVCANWIIAVSPPPTASMAITITAKVPSRRTQISRLRSVGEVVAGD